jgi:peroxiredoxin Q/BCP
MPDPEYQSPAAALEAAPSAAEAAADEAEQIDLWIPPRFQPLRAGAALTLTVGGLVLYEFVLTSFWSSPAMGIHDRIPWPAYAGLAAALLLAVAGVRVALAIASPHAKLGFGLFAFLTCIAIGVGGGRFVSYTLRGTLNPPFRLALEAGARFPSFSLADQTGAIVNGPATPAAPATLIYVYRGDFCPFARYQLGELTARADDFRRANVAVVGISADPVNRSKMLAGFLHSAIPLLSDDRETLLAPLGLVQHHRDGEPDNAIPAFFIVDREGIVRWMFTSQYYRELPTTNALLNAARAVIARSPAPPASPL